MHPVVIEAMRELGIDLARVQPALLTDDLAGGAAMLVTMGCGEACPHVPGLVRDDWPLPDPKGRPIDEVRAIRDDIGRRVQALLDQRGWSTPGQPRD
nr:hypothetical protein [Luteitalea pratensis]